MIRHSHLVNFLFFLTNLRFNRANRLYLLSRCFLRYLRINRANRLYLLSRCFFAVFAIQQSKQTIPFVTLFFAVSASRDDTNRQNFQSALLLPTT